MRARYGDARAFINLFDPSLQAVAARHPDRAYLGHAPCLGTIAGGYGEAVAEVWICLQIEDVNHFAGARVKMTVARQRALAATLLAEYPSLKASELLLFFHRFKCGRYERFYGTVDALTITSSLRTFVAERPKEVAALKRAAERAEPAPAPSTGGITYQEYLALKRERCQTDKTNRT